MTTQTNLDLVWAAAAGGGDDMGDDKYQLGWVSEIPTYQNFNFVLSNLSKNALVLAEKGSYTWQPEIAYKVGAKVQGITDGLYYTCAVANVNSAPESSMVDGHWGLGHLYGDDRTAGQEYAITDGVKICKVNPRNSGSWGGTDLSIANENAIISMSTNDASDNWLFANVGGEPLLINVGNSTPDSRSIELGNSGVYKVYSDDYKPSADSWSTPRTLTFTLSGDVAGTASMAVDGGSNEALTLSVSVSDNSHSHSNSTITSLDASKLTGTVNDDRLPSTITSSLTGNATSASKLQSPRTISIGGDVTGSATFDGSSNIAISASVANDSHTHDDRYFTETESNTRFAYKAGFGTQAFAAATITCSRLNSTGEISGQFTSDIRLKSDLKPIKTALSKVKSLRTVSYNKEVGEETRFEVGVIAQDVEKVFPHMVKEQGGVKRIAQGGNEFAALAFAAIKELSAKVEKLEKQLKEK
jgi:hypothetical protein